MASNANDDAVDKYHVKAIIKHCKNKLKQGQVDLLIQWVNGNERSWEPEQDIQDGASDLLFAYWEKQGGRTAVLSSNGQARAKTRY